MISASKVNQDVGLGICPNANTAESEINKLNEMRGFNRKFKQTNTKNESFDCKFIIVRSSDRSASPVHIYAQQLNFTNYSNLSTGRQDSFGFNVDILHI